MVTVTAVENEINANEKLRLLGSIMNSDELLLGHSMHYEWIKSNGLLTEQQIRSFTETETFNINLILNKNVLG